MNKKGFTLIEVIVVIVLIALIAVIAVPNVINMANKGQKKEIIVDAESIINDAKHKINLQKYESLRPKESNSAEIEIDVSILGTELDKTYTTKKLKIALENNEYVYSVYLKNETYCTSNDESTCGYVKENNINIIETPENQS